MSVGLPFPREELERMGITLDAISRAAGYESGYTAGRALGGEIRRGNTTVRLIHYAAVRLMQERIRELSARPLERRQWQDLPADYGIRHREIAERVGASARSVGMALKGEASADLTARTEAAVALMAEERHEVLVAHLEAIRRWRSAGPALLTREPEAERDLEVVAGMPEVRTVLRRPHVVRGTRLPRANVDDGLRHAVVWHPSIPGDGQAFVMIPVDDEDLEDIRAVALIR